MKKALVLIFLTISIFTQAQNLKGKVSLEKDKSPAQFASVGLVQLPDSVLITGVITFTDGAFQFEKVKPGNYHIKVSYLGYKANDKAILIKEGDDEIEIDTIFLSEAETTLNEATVTGERLKGKELVDRTVYSIPAAISKSSNNGYDILKLIPQVNVDFQNNVTMNGTANFIIQVDGRQRDKEFLAKLLPTDIESIEIINNPSGKYEGNVDGVINIILKKEARYGMNGNVGVSIKPFKKLTTSGSASLDYALGKITFYATAFTFTQNLDVSSSNNIYYSIIDSTNNMAGIGGIKITSSSVNTGFDYYMNDKNNLSLNISYKPIGQDIDSKSESFLYKNDLPVNTITSSNTNSLKSNEATISLFYKKSFKKAVQEFTTETSYYLFKSDAGNDFTNTLYEYNSNALINTRSRLELDLNERKYFNTKLNYVQPIGLSNKIEVGYQIYYQQMSYDFGVNNTESNNLFKYNEFRNSIYGGFTTNLKKIGFQAMFRIENSNIEADSVTNQNYTCFLPSVNLQYKFSASHNLKFTYNRRINRPGIYDMNPYPKIGQNYDITQGNPNLRPDYRDKMQLTYTWNFGSNYFSPSIYYEALSDKVGQRYLTIKSPEDSMFTTFAKPFNLLSGNEYGAGINTMLWFVNINARIFKGSFNEYTDQLVTIPSKDYFSYAITSYAFVPLDKEKKSSAYVFFSYNGVSMDAQTKTYSIPFYGFGAQKQLKNHNIGAFFLLPFSTDIDFRRTETDTPDYHMQNIIGFDVSYYIQFMYSYKFSSGKNVKKLDRKIDVESDSKSQGIGK